ncbi:transcription repressor OFP2 [Ricinus communis]|uniref:Transcription repressor n=1 Tax=Ricinus communis TaxID=3988 RepID=B9T7T4_RICCO|nr:transcription repressor OFP2 [Ricinus communis]EEF28078.1 hypothetical protein RCOM_0116230 [Ricinus communis]|eukprot:XP_002534303.1 transcription repressor OFP2 [Ricinus communis]
MGNYRFRLSDMMPNAWFYKLREMGKTKNHSNIATTTASTHPIKKKKTTTATSVATDAAVIAQPSRASKTKQTHNHHHHYSSYPRKSYHVTRELIPSNQRFHNSPTDSKYTDTQFADPPRKSSKRRLAKRRAAVRYSSPKLVTSSVSADCSCRATAPLWTKPSDSPPDYSASSSDSSRDESSDLCEDDSFPPEFRSDGVLATESFDKKMEWPRSCGCKVVFDGIDDDIIIDVDKKSLGTKFDKLDISDLDLPPIITKPDKFDDHDNNKDTKKKTSKYRNTTSAKYQEKNAHDSLLSVKVVKQETVVTMKEHKSSSSSIKRHSLNSPGLRLRVNSPRIAVSRRVQAGRKSVSSSNSSSSSRRSLSDSLAIVKSSCDPQKDFRESMLEMIVENNIRASKDLEDLLACYLSLNSDEYHDLIIKVFKQIWFDLTGTPSK